MASPQSAQASLDAIQAALKAVGGTGTAPSPDDNTIAIEQAMQALSHPVRVITPDRGPADFLSGGYGSTSDAARRAAGGAAGEVNILTSLPRMGIGGLAALADIPLHGLMPNTFASPEDVLAQGQSEFEIPLSGEYARGGAYTQGIAGKAIQKAVELGGTGAAGMADSFLGAPKTPAEAAKREAYTRTGGETAINLAMLAIGGEGADAAVRPGAKPETPVVAPEVPRGTPEPQAIMGGVREAQAAQVPTSDFQARMQQATPKAPAKPEKVTPEIQEANVSSLEAPFRATPADPVSVFPRLPKYLAGAKPRYGDVKLEFQSDLDRAAYIVGNPKTSSGKHADYLEWLSQALGTDENTALFLAKRSLAATKAHVKGGAEGPIPAYLKPQAPGTPVHPLPAPNVQEAAPGAPASVPESGMDAVDKALAGTRLTRTPVPPGASDFFTSMNSLRMGQGEGEPLPYTQLVRDVYPSPADEVISTIGEKVIQQGKGDPTRVHLSPDDMQALNQALSARGWPAHRVDFLEKLSASVDYARQNRQIRNEGYAPMRGAIQDQGLVGDALKFPDKYAVTARLDEFKSPRDFEKVCAP